MASFNLLNIATVDATAACDESTAACAWQAGQVRISTEAATLEHLAQQFWHRILALADVNDDQQLSLNEFQALMQVPV